MRKILVFLMVVFAQGMNSNFSDQDLENMIFQNPKFLSYDENCTKGDSWACNEVGMTYYRYLNNEKSLEYFTKKH